MSRVYVQDGDVVVVKDTAVNLTFQVTQFGYFPYAGQFRLPMKNLDKEWYEATRRFGRYNFHPERCEDWNLETGGDTDLGEPLVAPFNGLVLSANDWGGGIGKVIQILGLFKDDAERMLVWAGWHLQEMHVRAGTWVLMDDPVGAIGNAGGVYAAHLHEQICIVNQWGIPEPRTFPSDGRYEWVQPSEFYVAQGVDPELVERCTCYDGA